MLYSRVTKQVTCLRCLLLVDKLPVTPRNTKCLFEKRNLRKLKSNFNTRIPLTGVTPRVAIDGCQLYFVTTEVGRRSGCTAVRPKNTIKDLKSNFERKNRIFN